MLLLRHAGPSRLLLRASWRCLSLSLPAHTVVPMPSLSPTMTSGSIGKWLLKEGDKFEPGQSICEVETDKASVSFDATDEGYLAKILVGSGEIKCGEPIMVTVEDAADVAAFANYALLSAEAAPASSPVDPQPAPETKAASISTPTASTPSPSVVDASRVLASPYAKKLLRESGSTQVRLGDIRGSGANGRVTAADVEKALASPSKAVAAKQSAAPVVSLAAVNEVFADVSLSGAAHARAVAATHAKQTVPHYYLSVDVNLEALMALRATANQGATQGTAVSVLDFAIKAAAASMRHVPEMNSSWLDSGVVRKYGQVDVNVFGGAGDALHAPLLKDAAAMGVGSIAAALGELSSQQPGDAITPGTFSVHNLGMFGVKSFAPVILSPQTGALALGAIQDTVVPREDAKVGEDNWKVSPVMVVTLSCDHRVVDGAVGASWLSVFKNYLENPVTLLL